jgi:hypothetical protein
MRTHLYILLFCSFLSANLYAETSPEGDILPASLPPEQNYKPGKMKSIMKEMASFKKSPNTEDGAPGLSRRFSRATKDLSREEIRNVAKKLSGGKGEVEVHYLASAEDRSLALTELRQQQSTLVSKIGAVKMQMHYKELLEKDPTLVTTKLSSKSLAELTADLKALELQKSTLELSMNALKDPAVPLEKSVKAFVTSSNPTAALETVDQLAARGRQGIRVPVAASVAAKSKILSRVLPGTSLLIMGATLTEALTSGNNSEIKSSTEVIAGSR